MNAIGIDSVEAFRVAAAESRLAVWHGVFLALCVVVAVVVVGWALWRAAKVVRRALTIGEMSALALLACVCTYAAQKRIVSYPRTDPTQAYLTDNGSYVDSDTSVVHIDFNRIIAPDSAPVYIDRLQDGDETGTWVNQVSATFGTLALPYEFTFANATNYKWIVYTTWTPGPTVQTNGVWHCYWGTDKDRHELLIPVRTAVRVDGETIATPKSKENAQ